MNKKNILVVVNPRQNTHSLLDWYENAMEFELTIADSDERAIELLQQRYFDLAIADSTDDGIDIKKLQAILPILDEDLQLISYAGESSVSIDESVKAVFDNEKMRTLQRLLILDSSELNLWNGMSPF